MLAKHPAIEPEQKFQLMTSPDHIALNKGEPALKQTLNDDDREDADRRKPQQISQQWLQKPLDPKDLLIAPMAAALDFGWLGPATAGALAHGVVDDGLADRRRPRLLGTLLSVVGAAARRGGVRLAAAASSRPMSS